MKNKSGRPRKLDEKTLLKNIIHYIENEHDTQQPIKITKLAEHLQNQGLNVIYQDLSRYKDVKEYIEIYNSKIEKETVYSYKNKTVDNTKKVGGRPRKFEEKDLLQGVKNYVKNNSKRPELIKVTKVAKYLQEKGVNVTYQDLKRYKMVENFIQEYNKKYKEILFNTGAIAIDIENDTPIYEVINPAEFIKNNKTKKDIENAIMLLNTSNEKLTESYGNLQNKMILQTEKILNQSNEIDDLRNELEIIKREKEEIEKDLKTKNKNLREKLRNTARKMAIYEQFINKYHYDSLAEYALYLEKSVESEIEVIDGILDAEKYAKGILNLKDVADKYLSLQLSIDNTIEEFIDNDVDDSISLFDNDIDLEDNDEKEDDNKIIELNLADLEASLSILDDI